MTESVVQRVETVRRANLQGNPPDATRAVVHFRGPLVNEQGQRLTIEGAQAALATLVQEAQRISAQLDIPTSE